MKKLFQLFIFDFLQIFYSSWKNKYLTHLFRLAKHIFYRKGLTVPSRRLRSFNQHLFHCRPNLLLSLSECLQKGLSGIALFYQIGKNLLCKGSAWICPERTDDNFIVSQYALGFSAKP